MGAEAFLSEQVIGLSESIDDRVAALLQAGTGITLTYNDGDGTLTIAASSSFDGTFAALTDKPTTLSGYGITDAQPLDSDLTAIAALTTTAFGRSLLTQADAAATRSTIGAGTGTIGGSTGSTDNAVLRADGTGGATVQNSSFVMPDIATDSPNNTVNHASLQAVGATTNVSASIVPKGSGAFSLAVPDGTATGGNARGANAVDLQTSRSANTQVASGSGAFTAGAGCTASGFTCVAIGLFSAAIAGSSCFVFGDYATASGEYSFAFGRGTSSGWHSYGFGRNFLSNRSGQYAYATGSFSTGGDAQYTRFVARCTTTGATPGNLLLGTSWGAGATDRLTINAGEVFAFVINLVGSKSDGSAVAHYVRKGLIKRIGSTTTLAYVEAVGTDYEDNAATSVSITADDTNDALQISVTGITGETWRWVAVLEAADLGYGT